MQIAIPKEISGENRVALVPHLVKDLTSLGCTILLEHDAGIGATYPDAAYQDVVFYQNKAALYENADLILKVAPPTLSEIGYFKKNAIALGFFNPTLSVDALSALCRQHITSFALEYLPRISRAQAMDALSSQATAAGYKAALIAANLSPRFFPMLTTAAGTIKPSKTLVIGAGVAGLQTIATLRRLGAIVRAYDIRSQTKEQVESLGAKMINIDIQADASGGYARELTNAEKMQQQAALSEAIATSEVVISTALIPDKPAPKIITRAMVESMAPGSIIVDIAAQTGGNCELTKPGEIYQHQGVTLYGPLNLPSMLPKDASDMYAKNVINFLKLIIKQGQLTIDWEDPILAQSVLTHQGNILHQATRAFIEGLKS